MANVITKGELEHINATITAINTLIELLDDNDSLIDALAAQLDAIETVLTESLDTSKKREARGHLRLVLSHSTHCEICEEEIHDGCELVNADGQVICGDCE